MTNRELLMARKETLTSVERQKQHILLVEMSAMPCPACRTRVDALSAVGVDVDVYEFGKSTKQSRCPNCRAHLEQVVPLFALGPGWYWELNHAWLEERLHRANLFDREHSQEDS